MNTFELHDLQALSKKFSKGQIAWDDYREQRSAMLDAVTLPPPLLVSRKEEITTQPQASVAKSTVEAVPLAVTEDDYLENAVPEIIRKDNKPSARKTQHPKSWAVIIMSSVLIIVFLGWYAVIEGQLDPVIFQFAQKSDKMNDVPESTPAPNSEPKPATPLIDTNQIR